MAKREGRGPSAAPWDSSRTGGSRTPPSAVEDAEDEERAGAAVEEGEDVEAGAGNWNPCWRRKVGASETFGVERGRVEYWKEFRGGKTDSGVWKTKKKCWG